MSDVELLADEALDPDAPAEVPPAPPADLQITFVPHHSVPAAGAFALWDAPDLVEAATALGLPTGEAGTVAVVRPDGEGGTVLEDVPARLVPVLPVTRVLAALPLPGDWPAWNRPADSVLAWSLASKLACEFVAAGRLLPYGRSGTRAGTVVAYWRSAPPADGRVSALAEAFPPAGHALSQGGDDLRRWPAEDLLLAYCDAVADVCGRAGHRPDADGRAQTPRRRWAESWMVALAGSEPVVGNLRDKPEELADEIDNWAAPALGREVRAVARLAVQLETPETVGVDDETFRLRYHLQSVDEPDQQLPASDVWSDPSGVVELAGRRIDRAHEHLARGLLIAARYLPAIRPQLRERAPTQLELSLDDVAALLGETLDDLRAAGIGVQLPPELDASGQNRLRARIRLGAPTGEHDEPLEPGRVTGGTFERARLTDFRYELALGEDILTHDEFEEIVSLKRPLVRWRGQWVRVDLDEVERLRQVADSGGQLGFADALAAGLGGFFDDDDLGAVEAVTEGDVAAFVRRLRSATGPGEAEVVGLDGVLREYQERGVAWLQAMANLGLGAVLADDMGLGKTIEGIAFLTARPQDRPHLVVCPTSVVGNWERELHRFAPDIPVLRHHGPERPTDVEPFRKGTVVVTSYALLRRDIDLLSAIDWDVVIFDEAQQVKNTASKGAKAARELHARMRVAMTGTPIENRLSELWAILDLTNRGLLGSQRNFTRRYAVPIERWRDPEAAERLRRLVAPFILRRLKTDPEVSISLPDKTEVTVACSLTREQATLYQAAVDEAFRGDGLGADSMTRRGRILKLLTALKQICNHPAHFLGETGPLPGRSGKLARTTEILGEIVASGDRALVFTQYRKMGDLLVSHLGKELELPEVPFLHGGVPLQARDAMVNRFQVEEDAPPVLLVSLRAGGTGLNLTRATEVIHFDRWWNPAVEDQATDRVHRIGQTRPVTVHRLLTAGTIEDRITELLEQKRDLAESVVGTGEAWLTELGDEELRDLVALSMDDVEDEMEDEL